MARRLTWMAVGLLVMTAIAIFAVWLPAPLKKLGLFSCLLGGIIGLVLWKLKERFALKNHSGEKWLAFLLGGLAEGVRISETFRLYLTEQQRSLAQQLQKLPEVLPMLEAELSKQVQRSFTDFLALRYSAVSSELDQSIGSWGLIFLFALEILLCAGSAWLVFRYLFMQNSSEKKEVPITPSSHGSSD